MPTKKARKLPLPAWYLPKGTIYATKNQLEEASSSCELWGVGCGGLVVIAVIAEFVLATLHPPYDSPSERWGSAVADALIALGIVGEVSFSIWDGRIQTELRNRSNKRVEAAERTLAEATDRLAQVEFDNGYLGEKTAQAEERTVAAEAETARLKAAFGWRSLSDRNAAKLVNALRGKLVTVGITHMQNDPESQNFSWQLCQMFESAGIRPGVVMCSYAGPITFGIRVAPNGPASEAIGTALKDVGIEFTVGPFPIWETAIGGERGAGPKHGSIYIGPKPMPLTTEFAA
jgi:hypothetical protein